MNKAPLNPKNLKLYHFTSCPYCSRVRQVIEQLGLDIEHRDIHESPEFHHELVAQGGKSQVPSLRIERENEADIWLYESADIIRYLFTEYADQPALTAA